MPVKSFRVFPDRWQGIRNDVSPMLIDYKEWASSLNVDPIGDSSAGSVVEADLSASAVTVVSLDYYFDTAGSIHRLVALSDGKIFNDATELSGLTVPANVIPDFAAGSGSAFLARGTTQAPVWKDLADSTWKAFTASTGTMPNAKTIWFERGGPRMFLAPTSDGVDYWAWTGAGELQKLDPADGGGSEPIGEDREAIVAIRGGLGDNIAIYKANHIYVKVGTDPTSWQINGVSSDIGLTAPRTVLRIGKGHFFVHMSGAYFVNAVGAVSFPPLTSRIQDTWDALVESYGDYLQYAHAAYHPRENMIYLWVPNQASRVMNRLLKIYVPTGAITIHDDKVAGASAFRTTLPQRIYFGNAAGDVLYVGGVTNSGADITSTINTGIYSGNPPSPEIEKRWGYGGRVCVFIEATADMTVTVTPTVYRQNEVLAGTAQDLALTGTSGGRVNKHMVYFPDDMGWGFSLQVTATQGDGRWKLLGYSGVYEDGPYA